MTEAIQYAIHEKNRKIVYIKDADNGASCDCICLKCDESLEAIQGQSRKWHFRHRKNIDCKGAQETAIHKLAKQIILDNSQIIIPQETLNYSNAKQEKRLGLIIPDVTVFANNHDTHFEIVVRNPVDIIKERYYKDGQHKSIEIDLTKVPYTVTPTELSELVLRTAKRRKIFWTPTKTLFAPNQNKDDWWIGTAFISLIVAIGFFIRSHHRVLTKKNYRRKKTLCRKW